MNQNFTHNHQKAFRPFSICFQSDTLRRDGTMSAVMLNKRFLNTDQIFGAAIAAQESVAKVFGETSHEIQLAADRKMYEIRDNAPSIAGRMKDAST